MRTEGMRPQCTREMKGHEPSQRQGVLLIHMPRTFSDARKFSTCLHLKGLHLTGLQRDSMSATLVSTQLCTLC